MLLEILLSTTIKTALGLLTELGFGDEIGELRDRLTKKEEKKRQRAFKRAYEEAREATDAAIT